MSLERVEQGLGHRGQRRIVREDQQEKDRRQSERHRDRHADQHEEDHHREQDTIEGLVANRREVQDWVLSPEAYFNYLQYCEFKHSLESAEAAQKSATKAFWVALAAIVVSIASTLVGSVT